MKMRRFTSTGAIRAWPPANHRGPSKKKVPDHLLWSESLVDSELIFSDIFFLFPNPLVFLAVAAKVVPIHWPVGRDGFYIYLIVLSTWLASVRGNQG